MHRFLILIAVTVLVFMPSRANTQALDTSQSPGAIQPGQFEKQRRQPPTPRAGGEPVVPEIEGPAGMPEGAENMTFTLKDIVVDGMTIYEPSTVRPLYNQYLGETVSLETVFDIAAAITRKYREDGYILSWAVVAPQSLEGGVVRLNVVEGYVHKVRLQGDSIGQQTIVKKYADRLTGTRPLKAQELERFILLVNDLPGTSARVVVVPSEEQSGASDLVTVLTHEDWEGYASVDNRGSRYLGPVLTTGSVAYNTLMGDYRQLAVRHTQSAEIEEFQLTELSWYEPLSARGDAVMVSYSRSFIEPGFDLEDLDVEGDSSNINVAYMYPYIRSREENLTFTGQFDYRNSTTTLQNALVSEDRIRSISAPASYDFLDDWQGINLISPSISQGLDVFNETSSGSANLTRPDGRSDFTKATLQMQRLQGISQTTELFLSASAQYAFSQLLSAEEFAFGGANFGRAYDPSEITGDHGVAVAAELRFTPPQPPEGDYISDYEFYTYYDIGKVWQIDDNQAGVDTHTSAASMGLGSRFTLLYDIQASAEMSVPLTKPVALRSVNDIDKGYAPRFFFSLYKSF